MKFDSLIFDIDGTLWDATGSCAAGFTIASKQFPEYGCKHFTKEQIMNEVGRPLDVIFNHLYPELEQRFSGEEYDRELHRLNDIHTQCEYEYIAEHGGDLFPGVAETIPVLAAKMPIFIVSNCEKGYIELMLKASGLEQYFTDWLCFGDTLAEKNVTINCIVEKHGLKSTAYVGDILADGLSSQKAGVPFIAADYGFGSDIPDELCIARIKEFGELAGLIDA
ncbi:MAG: HAD family hydrolase [Eubacteriales bacterium]|nr:HAD family hydrolase [Eubacteriales bacterium]